MFQPEIYKNKINNDKVIEYKICAMGKYSGELRDRILRLKFEGEKDLGCDFAERIYKYVLNNPEAFPSFSLSAYDYLLPVPPRPSSLSERGYDQVSLIGERLSELCELPLAKDILESLERKSQIRISEARRFENVKGKFRLIDPSRIEWKSVLVLDDVCKTRATLNEVMITLNTAAPLKLDALVLAKTLWPKI